MNKTKEQLLRINRINNKENNLKNLYISILQNTNEGSMKKEIYELLKDEMNIIENIRIEDISVG